MSNDQRALTLATTTFQEDHGRHQDDGDGDDSPIIRDIHALTPPRAPRGPRREAWENSSHRSSSLSVASTAATEGGENFTSMSREFNALVLAGSTVGGTEHESGSSNLGRIREEGNFHEETNPLAIVPDANPLDPVPSPRGGGDRLALTTVNGSRSSGEFSVQRVKKEEVESKISAWQNAKVAKINNRFKREDAIINGWEGEQVQKATSWMKKIERKLEEKRAKAQEKMQNDIAKAHRKAEERRASAEAKRGTKVARILEIANLMRAVGRPPVKRSFF
ncbi:Remorin family protein [Perilla frutescens var. hirtella]|uniref:Remorin family protein n=1 Tax=Perilla frutescens var. hirtella TaxID=608512 RepID=A0AAD4P4V9_PERFH|nr:Remorin family protein [Perilla frutescens var. frutescens]KAH6793869.1 Remorin family protein [Perilla frutescens var. hirtella]KAH6826122.1 Remorin family protein [Perilla frutescens var. hirtella]